jgi:hypothetical protein
MRRSVRLAVAACAALATLAFAGPALAAYTPSLIATSVTNGPGKNTTMLLGHVQSVNDDATFRDAIYAPLGYGVSLTAAPNTKIGEVNATLILRGGGNAQVDVKGQVVADNPATYAAQAQQCTQSPTLPEAVWRLDVTVAGTPLHVPIYVSHTAGAEAAFASAKIQFCLAGPIGTPAGAQLLFALFDVNGVFTSPANTSDRLWRSVFVPYQPGTATPNPTQSVEGQAVVPGRVSLTIKSQSKKHGVVIITGKLLIDGQGFPGATIELYNAGNNKRVASARTNRKGGFTFRRRIKKKTRYQALTTDVEDLTGCVAASLPGTAQGCKTATLSFIAASNRVTAKRKR